MGRKGGERMKDYGMVRSTVRPEPVKVDEFSVWKHSDIQEITENIGEENEFVGWEWCSTIKTSLSNCRYPKASSFRSR